MTGRSMMVGASAEGAGPTTPGGEIRAFRLGDYGLIDVTGASPRHLEVRRALLWEWSVSPAGVIIRLDTDEPPDDRTVGAITADATALVHAWPGTPIGLISDRREVRELVAQHPHGRDLTVGTTLTEIWEGMWSPGGKGNFTIELPPTVQAPRTARDFVARACADWNLNPLASPAALLSGDLVARSEVQGATDIHFTVSRHQSRIRVLVRDDVCSTGADESQTGADALCARFATAALTCIADSLGEFALAEHHVRWAVTHASQSAPGESRPAEFIRS